MELGITPRKLQKIFGGKKAIIEAEKTNKLIEYELENALIKKACGYSYEEIKETEKASGTEITTTHKEALPDVSAAKFWLESRCPETWNSKAENNSSAEKLDEVLAEIDDRMGEE